MPLSNVQKFGAAAAMALATVLGATHADAQSVKLPSQMAVGECVSRADMLKGLDAEHQYILVADDAKMISAKDGSTILQREAYTSDAALSMGYAITGNTKGEFCKSANLSNIKLLDARSTRIDMRAYYQPASYNVSGTLNAGLDARLKSRQELPMLQVTASTGITITVIGNQQSKTGAVLFSKSNGALNGSGVYDTINTQYSPTALATLDRPQRTASLDRN